jgi:hypothetical protein
MQYNRQSTMKPVINMNDKNNGRKYINEPPEPPITIPKNMPWQHF